MTIKEYIEKEGIVNFEKKLTNKGKKKVQYPNWIITDMRFPNELKAVKNKNGITIRVNRVNLIENNHPSETSLDSATFDYVIDNNGTIEELIQKVRIILQREKLFNEIIKEKMKEYE